MHLRQPLRLALALVLASLVACGGEAPGDSDPATSDVGADVGADADADVSDVDASPGDVSRDTAADAADGADAEQDATLPIRGAGLGNVAFAADELFAPVGWFDRDTGVPGPDPDFLRTLLKPFGTNVAYMHNGYLLTLFAPDSGGPPGGLLWFDVSDPRDPRLVNVHYDPHDTTSDFREAHAIGFSDFDGRQHAVFHTGHGVEFWDLSDPMAPVQLSRLALDGVEAGDYLNVAWQLFWQGRYVYVSSGSRGVFIVDALDPLNPTLADRGDGRPNPVPPSELGGFRIGPIFALGNLLLVSSMDDTGGLATVDISDPVNPVLLASQTRGLPEFYASCFTGTHLVTSVRGRGAHMGYYDISDPFRVVLEDDSIVIDEMLYCGSQDEFVFQGAEHEIVKVDVSEPGALRIVGRGELGRPNADHGQVTPFGNLVFVGNDHGTGSAFMPHQAEPDHTPPRVTMVSPLDGDTQQSTRSRVGVSFSDNVEISSVDASSLMVRPLGGEALAGRYTVQGGLVNFAPDAPLLADTTYEIVVVAGGVSDWVGNTVAAEFVSSFSTAAVAADGSGAPHVTLLPVAPVEVGAAVNLRALVSAGGEARLSWSFGDDTPWTELAAADSAVHAYATPGHYTVVVRATNGNGWASASTRVTVHAPVAPNSFARSSTMAYDGARDQLWSANRDNGTVTALDASSLAVLFEVPVGRVPSSLAIGPDGAIWVVLQDDAELVRLDDETGVELARTSLPRGSRPIAIVTDPAGGFVAATLEGTGQLVVWPGDGAETEFVSVGDGVGGVAVVREGDDAAIYVSRFISPDAGGVVWRIAVDSEGGVGAPEAISLPVDASTIDAEDRSRGLPNYLGAPSPRPGSTDLWIPASSANILRGLARDGLPMNHENTVRAIAARIDTAAAAEVGNESGPRLDFNDRAIPRDIAFSPLGDWAFVVLQGSDMVQVVDAFTGASVGALTEVGSAPQALAMSADGTRVFVHGFLSRTVAVYDASELLAGTSLDLRPIARVPTVASEALDPDVLRGKRIFYLAADPRMSRDGYISCASCHLDGSHDGRTWDFTDRGEGLRNTIDLRGRAGTSHGPVHWTGNFDEIQDFENDIRSAFGGTGFLSRSDFETGTRSDPLGDPKAGLDRDLDALAAYVASLDEVPQSPFRDSEGAFTDGARRGQVVFDRLACADCHGAPSYTDSGSDQAFGPDVGPRHDVGTISAESGRRIGSELDGIDTPTLLGVWASPPYLHDGSAPTLAHVMFRPDPSGAHDVSALSETEFEDLIRFMLELESR